MVCPRIKIIKISNWFANCSQTRKPKSRNVEVEDSTLRKINNFKISQQLMAGNIMYAKSQNLYVISISRSLSLCVALPFPSISLSLPPFFPYPPWILQSSETVIFAFSTSDLFSNLHGRASLELRTHCLLQQLRREGMAFGLRTFIHRSACFHRRTRRKMLTVLCIAGIDRISLLNP